MKISDKGNVGETWTRAAADMQVVPLNTIAISILDVVVLYIYE